MKLYDKKLLGILVAIGVSGGLLVAEIMYYTPLNLSLTHDLQQKSVTVSAYDDPADGNETLTFTFWAVAGNIAISSFWGEPWIKDVSILYYHKLNTVLSFVPFNHTTDGNITFCTPWFYTETMIPQSALLSVLVVAQGFEHSLSQTILVNNEVKV